MILLRPFDRLVCVKDDVNNPATSEAWFRLSDEDAIGQGLAEVLRKRLDPSRTTWAYHPQSNSLGKTVTDLVLARILQAEPGLQRLGQSGDLIARFDHKVTARRRERKVDLSLDFGESGPKSPPRMVLEVKACMTEHGKARPRLRSELLQTLDIARALEPPPLVVGVLVFNLAERFLSPLNLPRPNKHDQAKCLEVLGRLLDELGTGEEDGYDELLVVPIDFDNDVQSKPIVGRSRPTGIPAAGRPLDHLAKRLLQSARKSTECPSAGGSIDSTSNA